MARLYRDATGEPLRMHCHECRVLRSCYFEPDNGWFYCTVCEETIICDNCGEPLTENPNCCDWEAE